MKHSKFLHLPTRRVDGNDGRPEATPLSVEATTFEMNSTAQVPRVSNFACVGGGKLALPIVSARVRCLQTNTYIDTYAMLDPGTNATYCTEELCQRLGARGTARRLELTTIAQTRMPIETTVITLLVSDLADAQEPRCIPEVTVRPTMNIDLSGLSSRVDIQRWPHLRNLEIPELEVDQVHLLIGQDCSDLLLPDSVKKGNPGEPFAIHTPLGWAINGPVDPFGSATKSSHFVQTSPPLERSLSMMWEIEGVNSEEPGMSQGDRRTLDIWDKGRTVTGDHYAMNIPFKAEKPCLPDNRTVAERRLQLLGKRLDRDKNLRERYVREMHLLVEKGYAEEVPLEDVERADGKVWYLPHHPVLNPKKPDKCRIVFDCAAKFRGSSLNDHIHQGPDLANRLIGVLLRFREGAIAFMADVEAMFLQVRVKPEDRDALRFLWYQDGRVGGPTVMYRMTAHLFGGVWSPSCANYALRQVAKEFQEEYPQSVLDTVLHNFYVDDCLSAVKTVDEAMVMQLLARRGFHLTKFVSNSPTLMNSIPQEEWGKCFTALDVSLDKLPTDRALGMLWNTDTDCFKFDVKVGDKPKTKRGVLSILSTVYDPLGCVSPFVLQARRLFQQLCRLEKSWDEPLPRDLEEQWGRWLNDLPIIEEFSLPRNCMPMNRHVKTAQLHHFCDASEYGYGAVTYLRVTFEDSTASARIMMAKSRLAPLKGSTIPRLELTGALKAVRLDKLLLEELEMSLEESVYWTDSTIVLWYLQSTEKRFQTYVANRVAKILDHTTPFQWRHVPTTENPADDASRGMAAKDLVRSERWIKGPSFLYQEESCWPRQPAFNCVELEDMTGVKPPAVVYAVRREVRVFCWQCVRGGVGR